MTHFFDIIIPVYNQVGKMDNCIASLKSQTFGDFRAIFVNDGSTDASLGMLKEYAATDDRFEVTGYEENGSLVRARYEGMLRAEAAYVLFLDSDDYLSADALSSIRAYVDRNPADYISFGFISEPEGVHRPAVESEDVLADIYDERIRPAIWKCVYSKRVIDRAVSRISPFYCNMGEDSFFSTVFATCAESFGTMKDYLYHYELGTGMSGRDAGVSTEKLKRDLDSLSAAGEHMLDYLSAYAPGYLDAAREHIDVMLTYEYLVATLYDEDLPRVVDHILSLKEWGYDRYYRYAADRILPRKIGSTLIREAEGSRTDMRFFELLTAIKDYERNDQVSV